MQLSAPMHEKKYFIYYIYTQIYHFFATQFLFLYILYILLHLVVNHDVNSRKQEVLNTFNIHCFSQYIETQGVTRKILKNKKIKIFGEK